MDLTYAIQQIVRDPRVGKTRRYTSEVEETILKNAPYIRKGVGGIIKLADEPGFVELPKGPDLDRDFVAWLKKKGLTPKDAGVLTWENVKVTEPTVSNKRLSTLSRQFQMEEQIKFWNGCGLALNKLNPDLQPYVNWQANEYYLGMNIDLWELYRWARAGYRLVGRLVSIHASKLRVTAGTPT